MFEFFSSLEVDGHTISPGYDYDAAKKDMVKRLGKRPEDFFLTRAMTREKFAKIQEWGERFTISGTPVYQEFLAGKRELTCTAWAIPTRNIKGWKAPCFLITLVVAVGHQVTRGFPAFDVACGNSPGGACQLALAGEKFLIDGGAENGKALAPFLNLRELLACHFAREEKIFRLFAQ